MDLLNAKISFLKAQASILSKELIVRNEQLQDIRLLDPDNGPSVSQMKAAIAQLNNVCAKRRRILSSAHSVDHVAQQIESLYREQFNNENIMSNRLYYGQADFSKTDTIEALPPEWPIKSFADSQSLSSEEQDSKHSENIAKAATNYDDLVAQLKALSKVYQKIETDSELLKRTNIMLETFKPPEKGIQRNLSTSHGDLTLAMHDTNALLDSFLEKIDSDPKFVKRLKDRLKTKATAKEISSEAEHQGSGTLENIIHELKAFGNDERHEIAGLQ